MSYPHTKIAEWRDESDPSWEDVIEWFNLDCTPKQIRQAHSRWLQRNRFVPAGERSDDFPQALVPFQTNAWPKIPETVDELRQYVEAAEADWEIDHFKANFWNGQKKGGEAIVMGQMKAIFRPDRSARIDAERAAVEAALEDFKNHIPYCGFNPPAPGPLNERTCAAFINVYDAHLGMLAQGKETGGGDYDLEIGAADYVRSGRHQLDLARIHPVREINIVIGHDLVHIDMIAQKVGTTAAGTPQDFDSRLPKIFTTAREVSVEVIDYAMTLGHPVNVWVVPGNHDPQTVYKLGEVLHAWYRSVEQVTVHYSPRRHRWHLFGKNSILMTHGERSLAKSRNIVTTALAEQPDAHRLALTTHTEILTGHLHTEKRGQYVPAGLVDAERHVTVRSLRGLTDVDAWHESQDYRHVRGSDLLVLHEGGGVIAQYTYFPHIHGTLP